MNYFELKQIKDSTKLLPWKERQRSFSEGIFIISKYLNSDFPNLFVETVSKSNDVSHFQICYGDIIEILQNDLTEEDANRLFELGWYIDDGTDVLDNYFKLIL